MGTIQDITERKQAEQNREFLFHLSEALVSLADAKEIMRVAAERIGEFYDAAHCIFSEFDKSGDTARVLYNWRREDDGVDYNNSGVLRSSDFVTGEFQRLLFAGLPLVVCDTETDERTIPNIEMQRRVKNGAILAAPFLSFGDLRFTLNVTTHTPRKWREDEIQLLLELAQRVWTHIERARATEALRASEEKYRTIVDTAAESIVISRPDGVLVFVNKAFLKMLGYSKEDEIVGKIGVDFISPDWKPRSLEARQKLAKGEVVQGETKWRRKDGSEIWLMYNSTPIFSKEGEHTANLTMHSDITARKKAEEALRESEEKFRIAQEVSPDGFLIFRPLRDDSGAVTDFLWIYENDAAARMNDTDPKEVCGKSVSEVLPHHDQSPFGKAYKEVAETGEVRIVEEALYDQDTFQQSRWFRVVAVPTAGGDVAILVQNITEHKRAEEALKESDRQKNDFIAVLSHELRNPMAAIRTGLSILERVPDGGDEARQTTTMINRQFYHLTRLVDDLLDVTRLSRNKITLKKERLDLCDLLRHDVEDARDHFASKDIEIAVRVPDTPLDLMGDRTRLSQVFANLLENAADFTPPGGRVDVTVEKNEETRQVLVRVSDTGIGIRPEVLPRLFEPFAQTDSNLTRKGSGLGLGLTLVKGLIKLHGGHIGVTSPGPGEGAEFTIRLPLDGDERGEKVAAAPVKNVPGRRILLIEDKKDLAEGMGKLLRLLGHQVTIALTGSEGMRLARKECPEVLLCDIGLPDIDGYEVAHLIRSEPDLKGVFLVALTGYAQPEDLERALAAGFDGHLAKPVELKLLNKILAELPS